MLNNSYVFPNFKPLDLSDQELIQQYTSQYPPYSDFYFFSIWVWDIKKSVEFSILNENLVVKFRDYITGESFLSFLGNYKILETLNQVFDYINENNLPHYLKLFPQHNLLGCELNSLKESYKFEEDQDNFDYVILVDTLYSLEGKDLHHKRKMFNKFSREYKTTVEFNNMNNLSIRKHLLDFIDTLFSRQEDDINQNEIEALHKILNTNNGEFSNLINLCIYNNDNNHLIGFTIFEQINKEYAISSFQIANKKYKGIFEYMNKLQGEYLKKLGCLYVNWEQDLGIQGLRTAKSQYKPLFLIKYIVTKK